MNALPCGYVGKMLRVDLTTGSIREIALDAGLLRKYVGGVGLGARFLYDEVPPGVEWDSPENRIIFATGPLAGTIVPGGGTFCVVSKGPMTNLAGSSQANGYFGAFLKFSGYDGIVIHGQAQNLSYLHIRGDGNAELRDASHLSMKDTFETEKIIMNELGYRKGTASVYSIGPAGEKMVRFANIIGDGGHSVSHNGLGAVMGAKRLKAIVVARGTHRVSVSNGEELKKLVEKTRNLLKESRTTIDNWGTAGIVERGVIDGWLPIKNLTTNVISKPDYEKLTGQYMRTNFEYRRNPCWMCPLGHVVIVKVTEGPYAGFEGEEPEYELVAGLGSQIGVSDPGAVTFLSNLVDRLGVDGNETGWLIGWIMECFEKGILKKEDLDGLEMNWGNVKAVEQMLKKIANRDGCGNRFAEGVKRASEAIGGEAPKIAVYTMKGASPRGHDHRGRNRWVELFDTCVSDTSTCQTVSGTSVGLPPDQIDPVNPPFITDPFSPEQVSTHIGKGCGWDQFIDCLGVCRFCTHWETLIPILNAVTGWDFTLQEAMEVGRRTVNLLRVFNLRHGMDPSLEKPSSRYGSAPVDGPAKGISIMTHWDTMLRNYRKLMGWDEITGKPLPETLEKLGLKELVKDLYP
jgi:aldehyde:ferredoxin oxidoreductase